MYLLGNNTVYCDFEDNLCPLSNDFEDADEPWLIVTQSASDNTINSGLQSYIFLFFF